MIFNKYFNKEKGKKVMDMKCNSGSGAIYGLGMLGALVYYLQHATSFMAVIIGIFKAIFWPGVLLYQVLGLLKM